MVTHDIKSASYANRVVFLKDGRIEGELDLKRYLSDNQEKVIFDFLMNIFVICAFKEDDFSPINEELIILNFKNY